jgi:ElaA protein
MKIDWIFKPFAELTLKELYDAIKLRQEVFVVEQHCLYLDADGKDFHSHHLSGYDETGLLACYARLVEPGISYDEVSIGRVVTSPAFRKKGAGKLLLKEALFYIEKIYGNVPVRIGAQGYLLKFYQSFGFEIAEPAGYFEDGILHYIMIRKSLE